jgi:deoxyribodipyrimidine photo-lyase
MPASLPIALFWFRRDLRLDDNVGLYHALQSGFPVLPVFIFDEDILTHLEDKDDARLTFIHQTITGLRQELAQAGGTLVVQYGKPLEVLANLIQQYTVAEVYTNHDYEPYAKQRDAEIEQWLNKNGIAFKTFKDQVVFERREVVNGQGNPYLVFTPYSKKWLSQLTNEHCKAYPSRQSLQNLYAVHPAPVPSLEEMGFTSSSIRLPGREVSSELIQNYADQRNFPAIEGTSRLGLHLRFGTVSVRRLVEKAKGVSDVWLSELIWREFFMMILDNFPHVVGNACKPAYDRIQWRNNEAEFDKWCRGETGYPIVDAGMRQLNATGFMHNRVRMITASFLVKHLLIDWRWGEAYFARKLLDFDLSSNNGNWQWAAGCGCDAAPYFRVFSPAEQTRKFDKANAYIRQWVPEVGTASYPQPMVDHEFARDRVLKVYREALRREESVS